jgi:hypothetical protein
MGCSSYSYVTVLRLRVLFLVVAVVVDWGSPATDITSRAVFSSCC